MTPEQLDTIFLAAQKGDLFAYFGYGSLVNRDTHRTEIYGAVRAKVRGWRRHWQGRPQHGDSPISLLSVKAESDPDHELPGLLVFDRIENLGALDEREFNYHRRTVEAGAIVLPVEMSMEVPVFIYEGKPEVAPGTDHAILQSFDTVVVTPQLMQEFGDVRLQTTLPADKPVGGITNQTVFNGWAVTGGGPAEKIGCQLDAEQLRDDQTGQKTV